MATFNKFNAFIERVFEGEHNLESDTIKVYLSNATPSATNDAVKADLAEITAGNGYTAGGATISISASSQTSGTYTAVMSGDVVVSATGTVGPFRYAVVYNDTSVGDSLIGWYDYGSALTLANGETFTLQTNGVSLISAS